MASFDNKDEWRKILDEWLKTSAVHARVDPALSEFLRQNIYSSNQQKQAPKAPPARQPYDIELPCVVIKDE
jgi:hypothetical protein